LRDHRFEIAEGEIGRLQPGCYGRQWINDLGDAPAEHYIAHGNEFNDAVILNQRCAIPQVKPGVGR
jgi:hypothetical protein